jgi:hypothetical protein
MKYYKSCIKTCPKVHEPHKPKRAITAKKKLSRRFSCRGLESYRLGGRENALHDALQLVIDLLSAPGQASAVLGHLQSRHSHTTSIGSLQPCITFSS